MKQHPFTHLGPGPYHVVDYEYKTYQACHGAPIQPGASCDHCSTGIMHIYWIEDSNGDRFKVGSSCVFKTTDEQLIGETKTRKRTVEREARRIKKTRNARREMRATLRNFPGLHEAMKVDHYIIRDIRSKLAKYGSISENQANLVFKIARETKERAAQQAADDARLIDVPVEEGRQTITGTVLMTRTEPNRYGYYGSTTKTLIKVETADGIFKLWGTLPESINPKDSEGRNIDPRGTLVQFDAKLTAKETGFGFFSRPTKAQVLAIPLANLQEVS